MNHYVLFLLCSDNRADSDISCVLSSVADPTQENADFCFRCMSSWGRCEPGWKLHSLRKQSNNNFESQREDSCVMHRGLDADVALMPGKHFQNL